MKYRSCFILWLVWLVSMASYAQTIQNISPESRISVAAFIEIINAHEDIIQAEKELLLADAEIEIASASPTPTLVFGNACGDISGINMPHQLFTGLEFTLETGGKRKRRIRYAKAQANVSLIQYKIFVKNFKRDALLLYNECWLRENELATIKKHYHRIAALVPDDSISSLKKKVELKRLKINLEEKEITLRESLTELTTLIGQSTLVHPLEPVWTDSTAIPGNFFNDDNIMVKERKASTMLAFEGLALAQSNRRGDIGLAIGDNYMTEATNPEAPSPSYHAISATLSIPIRFSSRKANASVDKFSRESLVQQEVENINELKSSWTDLYKRRNNLLTELRDISALINEQEKIINMSYSSSIKELLLEMARLYEFRMLEWDTKNNLAKVNAEFFWHSEQLPANHFMVVGTK
ncbi:hypothetical protein [Chryseosolibacter indicus]|uniref:TolC family protein n=1 Tax=Chryseosolibacter indicus TaxID=2782351 RepID=A0ABS5VTH5_9BACT|nr:hypothetical protein [Chryseosolibacter indicus]MBT1704516.1 hypothetical protein [Chryseosolibacter indicus]